jgi:hypothetical protein
VIKWWFIFFLRGIAVDGPFDDQQACVEALKMQIAQPILDQGFDGATPFGLCFQGVNPDKEDKK